MLINAMQLKQQLIDPVSTLVALAPAYAEHASRIGRHGPCPIHGGKDGFRMYYQNGDLRVVCATCLDSKSTDIYGAIMLANRWSFRQTFDEVKRHHNGHKFASGRALTPPIISELFKTSQRNQSAIQQVWKATESSSNPVARYLANRLGHDFEEIPAVVRAHNGLPYYAQEPDGKFQLRSHYPAMVAKVTDVEGNHVTNHRTFLTPDGLKAHVSSPKKLMPPAVRGETRGCSIKLYEPTDELYLTEGIETAFAVHLATGQPVWSCISAGMLKAVVLPPSVKRVFIMGDLDRSETGQRAADTLRARLMTEGRSVTVAIPKGPIPANKKSLDWLDVYAGAINDNE